MKAFKKYALLLLFLTIVFAALAISTYAAKTNTESEANYFSVYDPKTNSYYYYNKAEDLSAALGAISTGASDGIVVTLLRDTTVTTKLNYAGYNGLYSEDNRLNVYFDLNGKTLTHASKNSGTFIEIYAYTSLHVYSSKPGAQIISTFPTDTDTGNSGYTIFNLRYDGAELYLGTNEVPLIEKDTDESSATFGKPIQNGTVTYPGDNLTTYSANLITSYYGSVADNQHDDLYAEVNGGVHYNTHNSRGGSFILENDLTVNVNDATIYVIPENTALVALSSKILNYAEINFNRCELYFPTLLSGSSSKYKVTFNECEIASNTMPNESDHISYTNSSFTASAFLTNDYIIKGYNKVKKVNYTTISMNYSGGVLNSENPYTLSEHTAEYVFNTLSVDSPADEQVAKIDWITDNGTITEYWLIGEDIIPKPPISETHTDVAAYTFSPALTSTAESVNISYRLVPRINFTVKANLALYSDFVYNLYIPKSVADSDDFVSARIDKYNADGSVIQGQTLPVVDSEITLIQSKEYYKISRSILATEGDAEFRLVLTVNGAFGDTITHIQDFSIIDYADRVCAGNYAETAKNMVKSTVTYIKAARNYREFVENPDAELPYSYESNPDLTLALGTAIATKRADLSEELSNTFYAMALSLEESIKFRFYIKPESTETITFTYPVNTKPTTVSITVADCIPTTLTTASSENVSLVYYDITMRALDLRSAIKIDLSSTGEGVDYTYRLANYVYSVKGSNESLDLLMDTMFAYSIATNAYLRGETTDTPSVEIGIGEGTVSENSYVIVADEKNSAAAEALKLSIAEKTGESLTVTDTRPEGMSAIVIQKTKPNYLYDLEISVDGNDLLINYSLDSFVENGINSFIYEHINHLSTDTVFGASFNDRFSSAVVYYSDFNAVGDGKTDDFQAIYDTHVFANATNKKVFADDNASYYLHLSKVTATDGTVAVRTIPILTDTDWGNANICIDDSDLNYASSTYKSMATTNIFTVTSPYESFTISKANDARVEALGSIGASYGTTKIDLGLGYPAMLILTNSNHKVYRRSGASYFNSSNGVVQSSDQSELILVDERGYIDPSTPFMFDYSGLTSITVIRCDVDPLTVKGGTVTTIACGIDAVYTNGSGGTSKFGYFARGLLVERSNTTVENVKHVVIGEITPEDHATNDKQGAHYSGFFYATNSSNVLFKDCVLQGRRYYGVSGTYDYGARMVNNITLDGCVQSNFWLDENDNPSSTDTGITSMKTDLINKSSVRHCWGIGGTNFCKNMNYWNSRLSRFDAHCGLYNGSIINCDVTFFSLIGKGEFIIKDTNWYSASTSSTDNALIYLRGDYGSTWDGEIKIQNLNAYTAEFNNFKLVHHGYKNWYYGYTCCFPSIEIDNLKIYKQPGDPSTRTELAAGTKITFMNYPSENNMHLENTASVAPTRVFYNEETGTYSLTTNKAVTGLVNDNPITPPEYIRFLNNEEGYDFTSTFDVFMARSTFFNNTRIVVGTKKDGVITEINVINPGKSEDNTPILPFD